MRKWTLGIKRSRIPGKLNKLVDLSVVVFYNYQEVVVKIELFFY